ncbi:alpha/beta hydrolase family protein [Mycolicibacterium sp. HK-90]|uniref:alpha/beta hydrolase n=1 Tax=Mycolicibacterium sp. HK-90 TaxID=3056937 RepID=UPI0026581612|nr:alpha/beta hydrolase-fold protein [Mycolicibacterium sp. HK-90]WKG04476.1 alpha/beta hydrolase-fold protein [Mycolicibacterium sp. HK-90]
MTPLTRRDALRLGVTGAGAAGLMALGSLLDPPTTRASPSPNQPATAGTELPTRESGSFTSAARGGVETKWIIARPPGQHGPLRPVIALHGMDNDAAGVMSLGIPETLAQLTAAGRPPFAVVSVDGGNSFWRRRASGEDAGSMVLNELIPMLATKGIDTTRVAFMGWSMGGYGAMLLGARLGAARTAAVCAISPALYLTYWGAPPDAFDSLDDWRQNSALRLLPALGSIPLRIDCGTGDRFYPATSMFVNQLPKSPAVGFYPGGHDEAFWRAHLSDELSWLGS